MEGIGAAFFAFRGHRGRGAAYGGIGKSSGTSARYALGTARKCAPIRRGAVGW